MMGNGEELTQDERAELATLRAQKAAAEGATTAPATEAAKELPDEAYKFSKGSIVKFQRPDGTTGYGVVVVRAPMNTTAPDGSTLPGYIVATLGPSNDMPATEEDFGLEPI